MNSDLRTQLQAIYERHGKLTPKIVVEEARPEDHPLHAMVFDRSTNDAAEAWYQHRAQELIRSVKIKYRKGNRQESVREWVSVRQEDGYAYHPADEVAKDELLTKIVLRDMEREWRQLQSRYGHFQEFVEMVRASLEAA